MAKYHFEISLENAIINWEWPKILLRIKHFNYGFETLGSLPAFWVPGTCLKTKTCHAIFIPSVDGNIGSTLGGIKNIAHWIHREFFRIVYFSSIQQLYAAWIELLSTSTTTDCLVLRPVTLTSVPFSGRTTHVILTFLGFNWQLNARCVITWIEF